MNLSVGNYLEVENTCRNHKSQHESDEKYSRLTRRYRNVASVRRIHHSGIIRGESLRELILLAFLKEVKVEVLLNFLKTLVLDQVHSLARILRYLILRLSLLSNREGYLFFESSHLVIYGAYDGGSHRREALCQVLNHRVLLRRHGYEAVTVKQQVVILGYLRRDGRTVNSRRKRNQGIVIYGISHKIPKILSHGQLALQLANLSGDVGCLRSVHLGSLVYTRHLVLRLVVRDSVIHLIQFGLNG